MNFKLMQTKEIYMIEYGQKAYTLTKTRHEIGNVEFELVDIKGSVLEKKLAAKIIERFEHERDM